MRELLERSQPVLSEQPYPLVFLTISGAHLYGFPSPDSDYDLRGLHLAPLHQLFGLDEVDETISITALLDGTEIDLETHDAGKYCGLLLKKSGNMLEQIYSPLVLMSSAEHDALKVIARGCITRHFVHHYLGMAKTQWGLFEKENPRRVKPLLYVYRCLLTGIHLIRTGEVEANLNRLNALYPLPYIPDLIAAKTGGNEHGGLRTRDIDLYQSGYVSLRSQLEEAFAQTALPDEPPGKTALHDWLIQIRFAQFNTEDPTSHSP
jgi:hypothetical protein